MYMHGLRLFIVVLQEIYTLFTTMFTMIIVVCILSFVLNDCCVIELHSYLCPYCNVWSVAILQEPHCLPNCLHVVFIMTYRSLSHHLVLLL